MFRNTVILILILLAIFTAYILTFYKSGLNTLRTNPNLETIKYQYIEEDLTVKKNYFTWIGQATVLLDINDTTILFDPIFSERASPFKSIGPQRKIPPAININALPPIDFIFISHNHYDHLDLDSLKSIQGMYPDVTINVPKGDLKLLEKAGLVNINELDWWEKIELSNFVATFVPTKHWSARGLFDRKRSLWGGWAIKTEQINVLHIGDTAYEEFFESYSQKLGTIDLTFMPIGSYYPRDIEAEHHVDPYEAIKLVRDLESKYTYGIHWGGVFFSQEPTYEPQEIIQKEMQKDPNLNFHTSIPGIIFELP